MAEVRENPYWDAVKDHAKPPKHGRIWGHGLTVGEPDWDAPLTTERYSGFEGRHELTGRYSWTIPDPATIDFVVRQAQGRPLVDPCAGSGYWGWILDQAGLDVISFDVAPPPEHEYYPVMYAPVGKMEGAQAASLFPDRVLFLSWPPYASPVGAKILGAYTGDRVIFVGEWEICGDRDMRRLFERRWDEVAAHIPVRWWGLRDVVSVFERRAAPRRKACAG